MRKRPSVRPSVGAASVDKIVTLLADRSSPPNLEHSFPVPYRKKNRFFEQYDRKLYVRMRACVGGATTGAVSVTLQRCGRREGGQNISSTYYTHVTKSILYTFTEWAWMHGFVCFVWGMVLRDPPAELLISPLKFLYIWYGIGNLRGNFSLMHIQLSYHK